jgi:GTPase KRas protein
MVVDNRPCILEIIDTAGRGEYAALREDYIRDGDAFIIAYSVTSRKSFSHVRAYYNNIKQVKAVALQAPGSLAHHPGGH